MFEVPIRSGPEGYQFTFLVGNGFLEILNQDFPGKPWRIPITEKIQRGAKVSVLSTSTYPLRLWSDGDDLVISIKGLIPDEEMSWRVDIDAFNDHLFEVGIPQPVVDMRGTRWIDEGEE